MQPLLMSCLAGGKATCFAYGQTGSGKTHTMQVSCHAPCHALIKQQIPPCRFGALTRFFPWLQPLPVRTAEEMLQLLALPQFEGVHLFVSCFEIYGGAAWYPERSYEQVARAPLLS